MNNTSDPRRKHPRWYLHDGRIPFEDQTCGITGRLMVSGLLFNRRLCKVIIKDIGPGGVGFLAPRRFTFPDEVTLVLPGLPSLECKLMHRRYINTTLCFVGCSWREPDEVNLRPLLRKWRDHFISRGVLAEYEAAMDL